MRSRLALSAKVLWWHGDGDTQLQSCAVLQLYPHDFQLTEFSMRPGKKAGADGENEIGYASIPFASLPTFFRNHTLPSNKVMTLQRKARAMRTERERLAQRASDVRVAANIGGNVGYFGTLGPWVQGCSDPKS